MSSSSPLNSQPEQEATWSGADRTLPMLVVTSLWSWQSAGHAPTSRSRCRLDWSCTTTQMHFEALIVTNTNQTLLLCLCPLYGQHLNISTRGSQSWTTKSGGRINDNATNAISPTSSSSSAKERSKGNIHCYLGITLRQSSFLVSIVTYFYGSACSLALSAAQ